MTLYKDICAIESVRFGSISTAVKGTVMMPIAILKENARSYILSTCTVLLLFLTFVPCPAIAGVAVDCKGSAAAYKLQGIPCDCVGGQIVCDNSSSKGGSKALSHAGQMKVMMVGTILESLFTSLFTPPGATKQENLVAQQKAAETARQQAEGKAKEQRAKEAAAQAAYEKMMRSYKQLDDTADANFKSLSDTNLAFKSLDGDMETLAANARKPFDTPSDFKPPTSEEMGSATPFFGDTMPIEDIKLLVNPENDPRFVDLRKANNFVNDNIRNDSNKLTIITLPKALDKNGQPIIQPPDCKNLPQKLKGFIDQRNKFQKTINLAQEQLTVWEDANRNALINAAKDGIEYFVGQYLEVLKKRGDAADRLRLAYERNSEKMLRAGLDIKEVEAKIIRLKASSFLGKAAENISNANDWQTFIKDGASSLVAQLSSSDQEIKEMLEDPKMQKYFTTDSPKLNTLLDISKIAATNGIFEKWVAKQVPIIAAVEISIKQTYNGLDWYLSFKRLAEANEINGRVMDAARSLQNNINESYISLKQCP